MGQQYPNPPIREVICEFRYQEDGKWDGASPGLVYSAMKDEFPRRLVEAKPAVPAVPPAEPPNLLPPGIQQLGLRVISEPSLRFWRETDESGFFTVAPYRLAVSHSKPYPSWEGFSQIIHQGVRAYQDVLDPLKVIRIGLRYINLINLGQTSARLEDFFEFYPFVGSGIPQGLSGFHCLVQIGFEDGRDTLVLQIANNAGSEGLDAEVILDLDYFLAQPDDFEFAETAEWLENAHSNLESVFEGCLKDSARMLFQ